MNYYDITIGDRSVKRTYGTQLNLFTYMRVWHEVFRKGLLSDELIVAPLSYTALVKRDNLVKELLIERPTQAASRAAVQEANRLKIGGMKRDWKKFHKLMKSGFCWACGERVGQEALCAGHLVDRLVGGLDEPQNLVPMCYVCNMDKPFHKTMAEAIEWQAERQRIGRLGQALKDLNNELYALIIKQMPVETKVKGGGEAKV